MNNDKDNGIKDNKFDDEEEFMDIQTGVVMSRSEFNTRIKNGHYPGYYVGPKHDWESFDNDLDG
ncbi:MAG TPA: hypothetical protein PKN87_07645 [Syntrophomonadaceae bacterium]|nr:hypothetical protein [Syntrophomonadaceae bacterium]HPR94086.1 hypothetical protein [Syntrophomonadaceae bacterium]